MSLFEKLSGLDQDIQDAKNTQSGKVEYEGNSLQSIVYKISRILSERGVVPLDNVSEITTLDVLESNLILVRGVGLFVYNSEGEVDNITRFQALGGVGAWELVDATNAAAGAEQHVSGDLINPVQIQKGVKNVIVDPLLALDSLTLFLPANPVEGHELNIFFGGNIVSGTVVTAITISALPGYAILQSTEPTLILSGETLRYKHYEGAWYRV